MKQYLTFPVVIFKNGIIDIKHSIDNAFDYCLYNISRNCKGSLSLRLKDASDSIGVMYGNIEQSFNNGKALFESIPAKSPKTSISKKMLFDFYKNNKTEFEIVVFLAFAAIRSIIQKQPYTKITNQYMISRMAGNVKADDILPGWIKKYQSRYQLDKIKRELELNWGLKIYSRQTRGFYVSFALDIKDLIRVAELRRKKYKEKQLRDSKNEAIKEVLKEIYKEKPVIYLGHRNENITTPSVAIVGQ